MLRPLGLGELIDRAVNFWRANWKQLFQLVIGFQLVTFVLLASSQAISRQLFPLASDPVALQKTPDLALPHLMGRMALLLGASLFALYVSQLSGVATTWFTWSRLTGSGQPSPGDAFRHAAARFGVTTRAFIASLAWSGVVMFLMLLPGFALSIATGIFAAQDSRALAVLFGVLPGILLIVGCIVLVLWFVIRFILMSQVIAIEDTGAIGAFKRADACSSGRVTQGFGGLVKVRLTILVTVTGAILIVVSLVSSIPLLVAGAGTARASLRARP